MPKIEAVIFDLFGTLIDIMPDSAYEENSRRMSAVLGIPAQDYRRSWLEIGDARLVGAHGGHVENVAATCRHAGYCPSEDAITEAAAIRLEIMRENLKPRDHAIESVSWLKSQGMKVALLSDMYADASELWPETDFAPFFDAAVFSCDVGLCKPDPKIYEHVTRLLDVRPENCLYIGDGGSSELTGARNAGMNPVRIRVDYEIQYDESRPDANWDGLMIRSLAEVPDVVRRFERE